MKKIFDESRKMMGAKNKEKKMKKLGILNLIFALTLGGLLFSPAFAADEDDFVAADAPQVGSNEIANGSVASADLADGSVTTPKLADLAVSTAKLADASITSAKFAGGAVDAAAIATGAVGSDEILDNSIGTDDIADGAVDGGKIANASVTGLDIAPNAIDTFLILNDTILAEDLAVDSVTSSEIAADAVTSSELADDAVTNVKLAADAVDSSKILDDSVTSADIADGTITAADLAAGAVSTVGTKYLTVDLGAAVRSSLSLGAVGGGFSASPVLRYDANNESYGRWSLPVPDDYESGTDIIVELLWSPSDSSGAGETVEWHLHSDVFSDGDIVGDSATYALDTLVQSVPTNTLELETTGDNLVIDSADIVADGMINLVVRRDGSGSNNADDDYGGHANLHMVKIKYQAKRVN